ncbi:MAG: peptide-methionine (R)-S-oxide reductase MsrB [Flavobacteriaceae bacterium]|nr:peptide-methionine (R)-S-oxide reductase MsrB [Flavobacteriaceae bacterium]
MKTANYLFIVVFLLTSCVSEAQKDGEKSENKTYEVQNTNQEWKKELSQMEYYVLRKAGTEPAHSSPLNDINEPGTFVCAACGNELYETKHKFDSGTGWPSFDRAIEGSLDLGEDHKLGYKRDEAMCGKCGGHLGHIFNDGPRATTGMRHCINGTALKFVPEK